MSDYKHFSKMYILVYILSYCAPITLHSVCSAHMRAAARVQKQVCGVRQKIAKWKFSMAF